MKCFVIMPFEKSFDNVFEVVKDVAALAVKEIHFECFWLKDVKSAGRITDDIIGGLNEAAFCIADVSGHNPNVMWETGYAMALGKPTILIGQDIASLPFDLKSHRVLEYAIGEEAHFRYKLAEAIRQTVDKYSLASNEQASLSNLTQEEARTISVTGSTEVADAAVKRRIESILTPYLSKSTKWLIGSAGNVDIAVANFLVEHKQNLVAVGYNQFDCSLKLRKHIESGNLSFIDASTVHTPKGMTGPSQRDILFCVKSDIVILLWNGLSAGTKKLAGYFHEQGIATLLAVI